MDWVKVNPNNLPCQFVLATDGIENYFMGYLKRDFSEDKIMCIDPKAPANNCIASFNVTHYQVLGPPVKRIADLERFFQHLLKETSDCLGLPILVLKSKTRKREFVEGRMIMYKILKDNDATLKWIGDKFNRDHSTIISALNEFDILYDHITAFRRKYAMVYEIINTEKD